MTINMDIPGKTFLSDLEYLERLAAAVPENGVIVEVGPLFGRSTWTLAKSCHPSVTIYAIDTWEPEPWIKRMEKEFDCLPFSQQAFEHYTKDCSNIIPIKGPSPDIVHDWDKPIDAYFEDAVHGNPVLRRNLDFWRPFIKPGGIICGHDYTTRFPDVGREVDRIAQEWRTQSEVIGSMWAMRKPGGAQQAVYDGLAPLDGPQIQITTHNKIAGEYTWAPKIWAGSLLKADRMDWLQLDWRQPLDGLEVECRVAHPDHGESDWVASGRKCKLPTDRFRPIWKFSARLTGSRAEEYDVVYQTSYRQFGNKGHLKSGHSEIVRNGEWAKAQTPGAPMTALTVWIEKRTEKPAG